jgi:uncharacterized membrane protein YedE/YeeE
MKLIKFLITGVLFGIVMAKSEALSWFRIQEMFRFQSFHMYGIIGTAVILGVLGVLFIKKNKIRDFEGNPIVFHPKEKSVIRYIVGGAYLRIGLGTFGCLSGTHGSKYRIWIFDNDHCICVSHIRYLSVWTC